MALTGTGSARDGWSSRSAFILAAIGSAVGLGNLVRFPAEAAANGGGAFVLFYIGCVALIGLPLLLAETMIGRFGQAAAPLSLRRVAANAKASPAWEWIALLGVLSAFLVLSFYCVLGGWVLHYVAVFALDLLRGDFAGGAFAGMAAGTVEAMFPAMIADSARASGLCLVYLAITLLFVARGVAGGIEVAAVYLMPAFFALLVGITIYGALGGGMAEAVAYLFTFEPEKLTGKVMLAAVGQAFFSLSLGVAGMITYGAYVRRGINLSVTSGAIALSDTLVALIAGLCVFPIVFAAGLAPDGGLGLMFQTLPQAFQAMPFGALIGLAFFVMAGFAALTSSVALLEVPTAFVMDRFGFARLPAAVAVALAAGALGVLSAMSYGVLADFHPLDFIDLFAGMGVLDILDTFTSRLTMPIAGLLTAIFVGWVAERRLTERESGLAGGSYLAWRLLVRWVCPLALALILLLGLFPELFA